ncbi:MAG: hypothetical protein HN975_10770 [Anaerolineae bacterium]|jgi:hypothetical protein|nr:hypothetical protein [Anaerolineae bacterium]
MTITDKKNEPKYKNFKAALDPDGWNWYENRNGNWSLTGFSFLLNGQMNTVVFTAIGKRGKALRGGFAVTLDAFVDVTVRLLAYLWDVPEAFIRNAKEHRENFKKYEARLHRYELALDMILEEFCRVPEYMQDEDFGNKLQTILTASREYADYNEMTEDQYRKLTDENYAADPAVEDCHFCQAPVGDIRHGACPFNHLEKEVA